VKPPPFEYSRPDSVDEAIRTLARLGGDGKVLAGGQSLVPLLSMRLAAPRHLVDINRLAELGNVWVDESIVRVGALARHAEVLADEPAAGAQPLLRQALRLVAHATIRNRGTTVGSIVHADPSGEMTAVLALLDGAVRLTSGNGERVVPSAEFFLGPLESAVQPGELALEASFPVLPPSSGTAFVEVARRHGDYAVCGVAALVTLDSGGAIASARVGYVSVAPTPLVLDLTDAARAARMADAAHEAPVVGAVSDGPLVDGVPDATLIGGAAAGPVVDAVRDQVRPEADIHASADYRRHLAAVLTVRALRDAAGRAAA
jgi:carbon-monoxide dehydrogenase medium subunit